MFTKKDYMSAAWQFISLFLLRIAGVVAGLFLVPVAIWFIRKGEPNRFGELTARHPAAYQNQGSSGKWDFWNAPEWLWLWGNDEDGYLGEPSGKHSAREGGRERSFMAMYRWAAIRNPFNNASRYWEPMNCKVENCVLSWIGEGYRDLRGAVTLNDNNPVREGWYFVRAVDRFTGKAYYGYRLVKRRENGKIISVVLGFKLKPSHAGADLEADDEDKGFTFRFTFWATAN